VQVWSILTGLWALAHAQDTRVKQILVCRCIHISAGPAHGHLNTETEKANKHTCKTQALSVGARIHSGSR
jgi:hypothetical protein